MLLRIVFSLPLARRTLLFVAEHSCLPASIPGCKEEWRGFKWQSVFSPLDPELSHTGGVGGMARDPFRIFTIPPMSPILRKVIHNGRVGIIGCDIGGPQHAIFYVVYGWTGGHQSNYAATRTDGLIAAIADDVKLRESNIPIGMAGDLNCTPERLPHLLE